MSKYLAIESNAKTKIMNNIEILFNLVIINENNILEL